MKFLFALGQTPFDSTSGAAQATLHLAVLLAKAGHVVSCLSTSATEGDPPAGLPSGRFSRWGIQFHIIPVSNAQKHSWHHLVGKDYQIHFEQLLGTSPDWLLTFGDDPPDLKRRSRAREKGTRVLFALHNQAYQSRPPAEVDLFLSPSQFLTRSYREHWNKPLPILTHPTPIVPELVCAPEVDPIFVTFVNPQPAKGLLIIVRIAEQLGRHHPEIPFRIVGSRLPAEALLTAAQQHEISLSKFENIYLSENQPDVRSLWQHTRLLLMPSLWEEPAGRLPIEAAMNGAIPLVSDRGGLPEQVASSKFVLSIPSHYQANTKALPSAQEVTPWLESIVAYCRDESLFQEHQQLAKGIQSRHQPEEWMQGFLAGLEKTSAHL